MKNDSPRGSLETAEIELMWQTAPPRMPILPPGA